MDGRDWLDVSIGGIGACVLGYADVEVDEAFMLQADDSAAYKGHFVQCMLAEGILGSKLCSLMDAHTEARDAGDVRQCLRGKPAHSGFGRLA